MDQSAFQIIPETSTYRHDIETLLDLAFGLDRRTKTAYRLREGSHPVEGLCFLALCRGHLVGSIQFWPLVVGGETPALLLGPLAVAGDIRGQGCGRALMEHGLEHARDLGHKLVILVGDEPYYARVGFARVPDGQLIMPGPVDPKRLLARELQSGSLAEAQGLVLAQSRDR